MRRGARRSLGEWFRAAGRGTGSVDQEQKGGRAALLDEGTLRQLTRMRLVAGQSFTEWLEGEQFLIFRPDIQSARRETRSPDGVIPLGEQPKDGVFGNCGASDEFQ